MSSYRVRYQEKEHDVRLIDRGAHSITFELDGSVHTVEITAPPVAIVPSAAPSTPSVSASVRAAATSGAVARSQNGIYAPMPGIIVSVAVKAGDKVEAGQTIAVMEAMKMENNLTSPSNAVVREVLVTKGQEVENNQLLVRFE